MRSSELCHINLPKAAESGRIECTLDGSFFTALAQSEITGGDVHAVIDIQHVTEARYKVAVHLEGEVCVACDRCLDPLWLDTEASEELQILDTKVTDEYATADGDCIEGDALDFDLAWPLYEVIETSLPLQRAHAPEDCNPDMLGRISREEDDDTDNVAEA